MKAIKFSMLPTRFALAVLLLGSAMSCKEEFDHTVDTANPTVVSYNPVSGVEGVAASSTLVLTFDEFVKKGKGNITISGESSQQQIDVNSDAVHIGEDKRVLTIIPAAFNADETYTVTLDRGIVSDLVGNEFVGMAPGTSWTFKTAGESGLSLSSLAPANGGTDASVFGLQLVFAGDVQKGEGSITVYGPGDAVIATLPVGGQAVTVSGNTVSVQLPVPLAFATEYRVQMETGIFVDINGKKFKGFDSASPWRFTTTAGSGDELVVYLPLDDDLTDASGNQFHARPGEKATAEVAFVTDATRGKVVEFRAGSYAVLPKHNLLRPTNTESFSINLWVKLKGIGSDPVLFANSDWDSGSNPGLIFCIDGGATYDGTAGTGRGWIVNLSGSDATARTRLDWRAGENLPMAPPLSDDQWHMVTLVYNQVAKKLEVYHDGKAYAKDGSPSMYDLNTLVGPLWDQVNDYPFTLWEDGTGSYNAGSDTRKALAGFMDDLRIYRKALTATEVAALFNN